MVHWGLFVIGAGRGGLWWSQNGGARGNGELIAAQQGDYKVAPANDGARTFEGEGDVAFSASEGAEPAGKVDPARMPEEPAVTLAEREAAVKKAAGKAAPAKAAPQGKSKPATPVKTAETKPEPPASRSEESSAGKEGGIKDKIR